MWDQRFQHLFETLIGRIIPTYVGSTAAELCITAVTANHSHVCGINARLPSSIPAMNESFPRMWDQRYALIKKLRLNRIIPTYVGSTLVRLIDL